MKSPFIWPVFCIEDAKTARVYHPSRLDLHLPTHLGIIKGGHLVKDAA